MVVDVSPLWVSEQTLEALYQPIGSSVILRDPQGLLRSSYLEEVGELPAAYLLDQRAEVKWFGGADTWTRASLDREVTVMLERGDGPCLLREIVGHVGVGSWSQDISTGPIGRALLSLVFALP